MTRLPVRVAAERVGVTRQTLFKYIRQGKLSATIGHDGQKQIDVSELLRVFGELQEPTVNSSYSDDNRPLSLKGSVTPTTVALQMELERTKAALEFKIAELALMKERVDELKARETQSAHREREVVEERNRLIGVIEQQNRLLAAPVQSPTPVLARKPAAKRVGLRSPSDIADTASPQKRKKTSKSIAGSEKKSSVKKLSSASKTDTKVKHKTESTPKKLSRNKAK